MVTEKYPHKWLALIGLSLLSFTAFLDYTIVTTALPFIQKDLQASILNLQWVINIFGMVLCMFMIAAGQLGDLFGRKKVFFIGFLLFGIAALGAGLSPTIQWLIFFRAIQGFAGAIIFTVGVALLPQAFPENEQNKAIGVFSAFNGAGLAAGPFLAGILITWFSWRWVFWINIPIIITGLLCCIFTLQPSPTTNQKVKIDWLGLFLLVLGLGCLIYGIIHGEQVSWNESIIYIVIGIIALILLLYVENKVSHPLLDLTIFNNIEASLSTLVCIVAGYITTVFLFFDPLYLELIRKQSALMIGFTLLSVPAMQVLISLILDKLIKQFGVVHLLLFGLIAGILTAICHLFFTPTINIIFIIISLMIMGYAWGIANAGSIAAISESVAKEKIGSGIGTIFTFWNISGSVFLALASVLFHWRESQVINNQLSNANITLSPTQHQQISLLISEPEQAQQILVNFGDKAQQILNYFEHSFMQGFYAICYFAIGVMGIIFIVGLMLYRRVK